MRLAVNLPRRSRLGTATLALPLAAALIMPLGPVAQAQTGSSSSSPGSGTSYLDPKNVAPRTPVRVDEQILEGLPEGVSVDRVEWITDRWVNVFINSAAMPGKPVQVQILLARDWHSQPDRAFPSVWALDGLRAREDESGWTLSTNIANFYADKNVNVVLPVGGESSFYTDWQQPDKGKHYKWESFLTQELPAVLREGWRSTEDRAIVGLSMGGTAAINLAERFPKMWKFAGSFSGYLDTTSPGMPQGIAYATNDGGGYDAQKMWGPFGSKDWYEHDPKLGVELLKDMDVYVSAGNGAPGKTEKPGPLPGMSDNLAGTGLEVMSRLTTDTFVKAAKSKGVNVITKFRPSGVHDWPYWQFEMTQAWPHIADSLKLPAEDRGARCAPGGAIGEALTNNPRLGGQMGACISQEYDGAKAGKVQDFRGGRAYWSEGTGAHFLWGRIGALYVEMDATNSWLGYPMSEEQVISGGMGRFVAFENGNIYWTHETGAVAVKKDMLDAWGNAKNAQGQGWENGPLGYPVEAAQQLPDGSATQKFQNGSLVRTKDGKVQYIQGMINAKYQELGGPTGKLGFPRTDVAGEVVVGKDRRGRMTEFDNGYIYWTPETGAHVIYRGAILDKWAEAGWENSKFGYPTEDQKAIPAGGESVKFQKGEIQEINGRIVTK